MRKLHDLAKQYGKELEPRHREFVTGTTRGMMQRELSDLQSQQHGTRELMNLGRIGVFLETMYSFEEALVAIHTEEPSKIMAYVWGPVRLLIKVGFFTIHGRHPELLIVPRLLERRKRHSIIC